MSYNGKLIASSFHMAAKHFPKAFAAMKEKSYVARGYKNPQNFYEALQKIGLKPAYDEEGNIVNVTLEFDSLREMEEACRDIASFVYPGSYLKFLDEYHHILLLRFVGKALEKQVIDLTKEEPVDPLPLNWWEE